MQNNAELITDNITISDWVSFVVSSDIYSADSAFKMKATVSTLDIPDYAPYQLKINGELVMTGLLDVADSSYSKDSRDLVFTGRDYMGLVIDEYAETFKTYENRTLRYIAEDLLAPVPYISRKNIEFTGGAERTLIPKAFAQVQPGQTLFDILSKIAVSTGLLFYCKPDGALTFTKPNTSLRPFFNLVRRFDGGGNIQKGRKQRDVSKWYRKVMLVGQQQGSNSLDTSEINVQAVVTDDTHPLKHKTFVGQYDDDTTSAKNQAKLIMQKQKSEALSVEYTTNGYNQNDNLWNINQMCNVYDQEFKIFESMLIFGRSFSRSKKEGSVTTVKLGVV